MRINDLQKNAATEAVRSQPGTKVVGSPVGHAGTPAAPVAGAVRVTVSSEAHTRSHEHVAKVERLKQQIAAGTFKVDPHAIASRLVDGG